jgi:heme-degrading monooxygenase HmoA
MAMFVAMNRFRVIKDEVEAFEQRWIGRDSQLHTVPGFVSFNLLRGPEREDHILYASHTIWKSPTDFEAWTRSEAFRQAHAGAGQAKPLTLGHPDFEGFEAVGGAARQDATAV